MRGVWPLLILGLLVGAMLLPAPSGGGVPPRTATPHSAPSYANRGLYLFNTSDARVSGARGVAMEVTAFSMPTYTGSGPASFQVVVGVSTEGTLVVAGLEANNSWTGPGVYSFAAVLNGTTLGVKEIALGPAPAPGSLVNVEVTLSGPHTWEADVNGTTLLNWTSGGGALTSPNDLYLAAFPSWNSTAWLPTELYLPQLIEVENATGWILPENEYVTWLANSATLLPPWNIASTTSNSSFAPGEVLMGAHVVSPDNGSQSTELWSSVPSIPATLVGTPSSTTVVGGQTLGLDWRVESQGAPLAGVRVGYWNSLGGPYGFVATNAEGWANASVVAPNVTAQREDFLNGTILNATYYGAGSVVVGITSVIQLSVSIFAHNTTVNGRSMVEIETLVTNSGTAQGDAEVFPAASVGGGVFTPAAPWTTNSQGYAFANYTPPPISGEVTVWMNASYAGSFASGFISVVVNGGHSTTPSKSSSTPVWEYGAVGAGLAVVIIVVMVGISKLRRPPLEEDSAPESEPEAEDRTAS